MLFQSECPQFPVARPTACLLHVIPGPYNRATFERVADFAAIIGASSG